MNQPQPADQTPHTRGRRNGIKWAIAWLHKHALTMSDPQAKTILNTAAFQMSVAARDHGAACEHPNKSGQGTMNTDGSGSGSWSCPDCGAHDEWKTPARVA